MEETITEILEKSTEANENPDMRDRGYIYWRLLSEYPEETKDIVLAKKPLIKGEGHVFEEELLESLINNIGMISSVYHKTPFEVFP